jgi:undecaprenyl-diphosphatase
VSAGQIAATVAAVALAGFLAWRWRRLELERKALLVLAALALAVYASGVLSELPDPKEVIGDIAEALGAWTYAVVGVMAFLETGAFVGLIAPGETVVIAGGVIAGQGEIDLLPLIGLVWICAVLGDTTSFYIGRRLGRDFLERHGPRVKITHERLEQVEGYFDRHGGKTILVGRFIGLVRALAPFIAGASRLPYGRFIPFSIVGTGLWATTFCVLGYVFWRSFDKVAHIAGQAVFGFGVTVAVIVGVVVAYRRRAEIRDWFLARERHPRVRPLVVAGRWAHRLLGPEVRFVSERLSLKLVTAMSVAGGGANFFTIYTVVQSRDHVLTPFDS